MHLVALGVCKKLLSLWFDQKYAGYPWYLGKYLNEIDEELLQIRPPKFLKRTPRSLKERQHWKASEYRAFLFYYTYHFNEIFASSLLPSLVRAMLVYTSDYITMKNLRAAEIEMAFFVKIFEKVYGLIFDPEFSCARASGKVCSDVWPLVDNYLLPF